MEQPESRPADEGGGGLAVALARALWLAVLVVETYYVVDALTGGASSRWAKERFYAFATPAVYRWRLERQVRREAPYVLWEALVAKEAGS